MHVLQSFLGVTIWYIMVYHGMLDHLVKGWHDLRQKIACLTYTKLLDGSNHL